MAQVGRAASRIVAYVGEVLRRLVLLAFLPSVVACHGATEPPRSRVATAAPRAPAATPATAAPVSASACRGEPSTVYGDEPVTFRIEAPRQAQLPVTLLDERGREVEKATVAVPGTFRPGAVPSGDFTLRAGAGPVACAVTVNRELPRASPPTR